MKITNQTLKNLRKIVRINFRPKAFKTNAGSVFQENTDGKTNLSN